jgi:hypothetical protein
MSQDQPCKALLNLTPEETTIRKSQEIHAVEHLVGLMAF